MVLPVAQQLNEIPSDVIMDPGSFHVSTLPSWISSLCFVPSIPAAVLCGTWKCDKVQQWKKGACRLCRFHFYGTVYLTSESPGRSPTWDSLAMPGSPARSQTGVPESAKEVLCQIHTAPGPAKPWAHSPGRRNWGVGVDTQTVIFSIFHCYLIDLPKDFFPILIFFKHNFHFGYYKGVTVDRANRCGLCPGVSACHSVEAL